MTMQGRWVFSDEPVRVEVDDGVISEVARIDDGDERTFLSPGFIDAQVNGYNGSDYSLDDLSQDHIRAIVTEMAHSGATRHVATIVTSPQSRILKNLELIAQTVQNVPDLQGSIPGIHLEGPYISEEDGPRGAHDRAYVRNPDRSELSEWIDASDNLLCVVTLAPERDGSLEYIEALTDAGIVASIGHTGASPEQIRLAVDAGATLSTHLGNGSHAMLPRLKNYLWEQLAADSLYMGMICDGFHLPGSVVQSLVRAKGLEKTILVSDVALYGGTPPGRYKWGNIDVEVHDDGHLGVADTPYLAGAGHTLDWDIARFCEFTGQTLAETVRTCTSNPASLFGFESSEKVPNVGDPADLTQFAFSEGDESLDVQSLVRGTFEYTS